MYKPLLILVVVALCIISCSAVRPQYYPFGPQTDVPEADLVGWKRCWITGYNEAFTDDTNITRIFKACPGNYLLYACRPFGAANLTLLAAGVRTTVLSSTGDNSFNVTRHNGADWYFYPDRSIGFAFAGDIIQKDDCDSKDGTYPQYKLCWNAIGNSQEGVLYQGYRCGTAIGVSMGWNREIWVPDPCQGKSEGENCDDDNACTSNTTCQFGICTGGTAVTCDKCYKCDTTDGCLAQSGTSCSDDDKCTDNDTCQQGVCIGDSVTCSIPTGCFNSTCSALTGQCVDDCPLPVTTPVTLSTPVTTPVAKTSGANKLIVVSGIVLAVLALIC